MAVQTAFIASLFEQASVAMAEREQLREVEIASQVDAIQRSVIMQLREKVIRGERTFVYEDIIYQELVEVDGYVEDGDENPDLRESGEVITRLLSQLKQLGLHAQAEEGKCKRDCSYRTYLTISLDPLVEDEW